MSLKLNEAMPQNTNFKMEGQCGRRRKDLVETLVSCTSLRNAYSTTINTVQSIQYCNLATSLITVALPDMKITRVSISETSCRLAQLLYP